MKNRIHFVKISHYGYYNQGDIFCSPYPHFEFFFKNYDCVLHSIDGVHLQEISESDVVIIGGGGLLNYETRHNVTINKILDKCKNVILWGCGENGEFADGYIKTIQPNINYSKFKLAGVRDCIHPELKYTPCPSSLMPQLRSNLDIDPIYDVGTMFYSDDLVDRYAGKFLNQSHYANIDTVLKFIQNHSVIITQSYHCALWATLSGRKVIMPKWSLGNSKFNTMMYPPTFMDEEDIYRCRDFSNLSLNSYPNSWEESRSLVLDFFNNVKAIIEDVIIEETKSDFYQLHRLGELSQLVGHLYDQNLNLRNEINELRMRLDRE